MRRATDTESLIAILDCDHWPPHDVELMLISTLLPLYILATTEGAARIAENTMRSRLPPRYEDSMRKETETNRDLVRATALSQSAPARMISDFDIDKAIQCLFSTLGRYPVDAEIAEQLHISLAEYLDVLNYLEATGDVGPESGESEEKEVSTETKPKRKSSPSQESKEWPQFSRRCAEEEIHNCLPTGAASPNDSSAWIISAPEIERAIRRLCGELGRSPTDIEIAAKLNRQYHRARSRFHYALVMKSYTLERRRLRAPPN